MTPEFGTIMLALHSRVGLRWIAVFEAAKGLFILLAGIGLLWLVHRDVRDTAEQLIRRMALKKSLDGSITITSLLLRKVAR